MKTGKIFVYIFISILFFLPFKSFALERVFYFRDGDLSRESLFKYYPYIDVLSPQAYFATENGEVKGDIDEKIINFCKEKKIKIMPLITNNKFSQKTAEVILDNPPLQDDIIATMIDIAKKKNFYGWQIDFEQMDFSYRDKFSLFVKRAHEKFKENGLILSVAVIAQVSENPEDYKNTLWQKPVGVYDYKKLGENSDFISIMSYDDPDSKGPVARCLWYKKVMENALKYVPKEKISFGLGLYYWKWDDKTLKLVETGGRKGISNVFKKYKYKYHYSLEHEAPYITYKVRGKNYTLWYENARSVKKKIDLIKKNKLRGFSVWALGLEMKEVYQSMKK